MKSPNLTRSLIEAVIVLLMCLSVLHSHEYCVRAEINDVFLYDAILVASYASLFTLKSKFAHDDSHEANQFVRHVWLVRGIILLLLLLPHILCSINAPLAGVSSATVIDSESAIALLELGILEYLIDIWLGFGGGPSGGTSIKPKNKEKVS